MSMINFDTFLRYFDGKALPEEAMRIQEWVEESADNRIYFESLHQSWLVAGDELYIAPDAKKDWESFRDKHQVPHTKPFTPGKTSWLSKVAAAAAIVVVALGGYYMFNTSNQNEKTIIFAAEDKAAEIKLQDGTQVTVQKDGELVYPVQFKKEIREVTLVGNGSFNVQHNPAQPFVVHLGDTHIKVLGTSFDIYRKVGVIGVKVHTGKVAFYNKADTLVLTAGQTGKYLKADKKFLLEPDQPVYGSFDFNNMPLGEVVTRLNAHFKVNITLINKDIAQCRITAGFKEQKLEYILKAITETFNLSYKIDATHIEINGKACN